MIKVNIEKAKVITKDRLRDERDPLLKQLDVEYIRAQEQGQDTTGIVEKKQKLRDITKEVDKAQTVEELKALKVE